MCGIAGLIMAGAQMAQPALDRLSSALAHRGPDDHACVVRAGIAVAHRRLAIIDVEHGRQPIFNETDSVCVAANCEIYNYRVLREELLGYGHVFRTASDAEVIVHGYEQWGTDLFRRLRGMFAIAIVDFDKRVTVLARDHFGIKPLFWYDGRDIIAFASELGALRTLLGSAAAGRLRALDDFLRYRYIPQPQTVFERVYAVPPASWMEVSFEARVSAPVTYWRVDFEPEAVHTDAYWQERAEHVLRESVRAHLVADVPYGVLLSGGIDSTLVACLASRLSSERLPAFSIAFSDQEYSEERYAREAAEKCGLALFTHVVGPDSMAELPSIASHLGQPFGDPSILPTWNLGAFARQQVPMVLSGDGGDEAFGGYDSYAGFAAPAARYSAVQSILRRPVAAARLAAGNLRWRVREGGSRGSRWQRQVGYLHAARRHALWLPEYRSQVSAGVDAFADAAAGLDHLDALSFAQTMDYRTYLPGNILPKVDLATMAHGLEVRTPFVDCDVVEFAAALPPEQRLRSIDGRVTQKYLLKRLLGPEFGQAFIHRPKQGFVAPHARWLREDKAALGLVRRMFLDPMTPLAAVFRPLALRQLQAAWTRHGNEGAQWPLLMLGLWLEANPDVRFG